MIPLLMVLLARPTLADDAEFRACAAAVGLPAAAPELLVMGVDTLTVPRGAGTEAVGLWRLSCDGTAFFEVDASARFDVAPRPGEVSSVWTPRPALACFMKTCSFPRGACPHAEGGAPVIRRCDALMAPATFTEPGPPPPSGRVPVLVRGKPVMVTPVRPQAASPSPATPTAARTTTAQPTPGGAFVVPPTPDGPCTSSPSVAAESRRQLSIGNEAEVAGRLDAAADGYRAALSLDRCNAFGWVALGGLALRMNEPEAARRSLETALALQPTHYGAATDLGRALEALGRRDEAASAYQKALVAKPGHPPAAAALERLEAAR